jgi:hypothetical protein
VETVELVRLCAAGWRLVRRTDCRPRRAEPSRIEQRVEQVNDRAAQTGGAVERRLMHVNTRGSVVFNAAEESSV